MQLLNAGLRRPSELGGCLGGGGFLPRAYALAMSPITDTVIVFLFSSGISIRQDEAPASFDNSCRFVF